MINKDPSMECKSSAIKMLILTRSINQPIKNLRLFYSYQRSKV